VPSTSSGVNFVRGGGLSIAASQTLFDSGKREQLNAQLRHEVQAARFGQEDECQQVIYSVTNAYYGLLEATDLTKVADAQVNRYNEVLNLTKAQAALGAIAPMDIDQAQADLATAQVTLIQDQNGVHTASATLKNVMGVESNEQVVPSALAQGTDLPAMPAVADTVTLDQAVQTAYNSRPDLKQQAAVVQSDVAATKSAELDAKLSLSSTVALAYQATNDVGSRGLDTQVQVVASYPLFDAGATRGAIREAAGARDGAVDQLIAARQNVREAVEQQYYSRAETIEAARLAQVAVKAAQTTFDAAVASRKAGVSTIVDVTTAQATLTQAQDQYVEAVYEYYIADAALARAMGTNDTGVAH
jgi:outer membrane protein TolC